MIKKVIKKVCAGLFVSFAISSVWSQARKVDVWDFGGVEEDGANNYISVEDFDKMEGLGPDGKFAIDGDITFGDLTMNVVKNDRAYYSGKKNYGSQGYVNTEFEDD